jgi:hypothetical protein
LQNGTPYLRIMLKKLKKAFSFRSDKSPSPKPSVPTIDSHASYEPRISSPVLLSPVTIAALASAVENSEVSATTIKYPAFVEALYDRQVSL